jgi:hypothetical protein
MAHEPDLTTSRDPCDEGSQDSSPDDEDLDENWELADEIAACIYSKFYLKRTRPRSSSTPVTPPIARDVAACEIPMEGDNGAKYRSSNAHCEREISDESSCEASGEARSREEIHHANQASLNESNKSNKQSELLEMKKLASNTAVLDDLKFRSILMRLNNTRSRSEMTRALIKPHFKLPTSVAEAGATQLQDSNGLDRVNKAKRRSYITRSMVKRQRLETASRTSDTEPSSTVDRTKSPPQTKPASTQAPKIDLPDLRRLVESRRRTARTRSIVKGQRATTHPKLAYKTVLQRLTESRLRTKLTREMIHGQSRSLSGASAKGNNATGNITQNDSGQPSEEARNDAVQLKARSYPLHHGCTLQRLADSQVRTQLTRGLVATHVAPAMKENAKGSSEAIAKDESAKTTSKTATIDIEGALERLRESQRRTALTRTIVVTQAAATPSLAECPSKNERLDQMKDVSAKAALPAATIDFASAIQRLKDSRERSALSRTAIVQQTVEQTPCITSVECEGLHGARQKASTSLTRKDESLDAPQNDSMHQETPKKDHKNREDMSSREEIARGKRVATKTLHSSTLKADFSKTLQRFNESRRRSESSRMKVAENDYHCSHAVARHRQTDCTNPVVGNMDGNRAQRTGAALQRLNGVTEHSDGSKAGKVERKEHDVGPRSVKCNAVQYPPRDETTNGASNDLTVAFRRLLDSKRRSQLTREVVLKSRQQSVHAETSSEMCIDVPSRDYVNCLHGSGKVSRRGSTNGSCDAQAHGEEVNDEGTQVASGPPGVAEGSSALRRLSGTQKGADLARVVLGMVPKTLKALSTNSEPIAELVGKGQLVAQEGMNVSTNCSKYSSDSATRQRSTGISSVPSVDYTSAFQRLMDSRQRSELTRSMITQTLQTIPACIDLTKADAAGKTSAVSVTDTDR